MNLTERLKVIAYQLLTDSGEQVTRKNHRKMTKFVKDLYYNATPEGKLKMQSEWAEQRI
jgi:hypothetical protein